jgi:dTMP kinase
MGKAKTRGQFITFEGGEGSGKTTQIAHLAAWLQARGIAVVKTREPGGSPMAEQIRTLLLTPGSGLDAEAQLFLFSAARRDHVMRLILPALKEGNWVLCDRFTDSTFAYQGAAGSVSKELIETCTIHATAGLKPDLTVLLDLPPETGLARAQRRRGKSESADAFEEKTLVFHRAVREGFRAIAKAEPDRVAVFDAALDEGDLAEKIAIRTEALLKRNPA